MKTVGESFQNKVKTDLHGLVKTKISTDEERRVNDEADYSYNLRNCPQCEMKTIRGMSGGRDASCKNCGYKDPCCYD